jgi:alkane 1-monooxygenase
LKSSSLPNSYNLTSTEKELAREDFFFDLVVFLLVPIHLFVIYYFLATISDPTLTTSDLIARVLTMGTILGVNGINIGHELGHKTNNPLKQVLAQVMLTTSVQNHFLPYHNGGHHRDVGTPADLTSAKKGDNFYFFALRSQIGGYFKTWKLEAKRLKAQGKNPVWNPMILYTLLPILLLMAIYAFFGPFVAVCYFLAAVYGISILESQNYFAHYGLRRKKLENGRYERVNARHSWNSDHIIGRVLLFELTRHSDHHHMGAKPYQVLDSKEESPMLPYGYPMMLILAYFPFLFRPIMAKQLKLYGIE